MHAPWGDQRATFLVPRPRPPPMTSSERGRRFRARQRHRVAELEQQVQLLREHVVRLEHSRELHQERRLQRRDGPGGSLERTIIDFFRVFQDGLPEPAVATDDEQLNIIYRRRPSPRDLRDILRMEEYIRRLFDPDALVGDLYGHDAIIDQWRRYTLFHDSFHIDVQRVESVAKEPPRSSSISSGSVQPTTTYLIHNTATVVLSYRTFQRVFPMALQNAALVQKLIGRRVVYNSLGTITFGADGRIVYYCMDVDFINGLRAAGVSLREIGEMLNRAQLTSFCMICDDSSPQDFGDASVMVNGSGEWPDDKDHASADACIKLEPPLHHGEWSWPNTWYDAAPR